MKSLKLLILFSILFLCGCTKEDDEFNTTPEYVLIDKETMIS
jgi:uncharacterized lipoprotein YajG|tara:strand:- start:133 stop:258 length:126 start_codon:yes stop_codon:yes gene_type:complete